MLSAYVLLRGTWQVMIAPCETSLFHPSTVLTRFISLGLFAALFMGCQSEPSNQAWNRPPKSELSRNWLQVWNPEVDAHRQETPYP